MSEKIRCGKTVGIDLNQVLAWKRIPIYRQELLDIEEWCLRLYIPGNTITIRKYTPDKGVSTTKGGDLDEQVALEEDDFNKLLECLVEEFSCDISQDSNLLPRAFPK